MTNSIREIRDADCIFITGSNTAESHPVISYEVIRAARRGANLIIVDPRRIPLVEHATLFLQVKPGTDIYVFLAIMHTIIREGWADEASSRSGQKVTTISSGRSKSIRRNAPRCWLA